MVLMKTEAVDNNDSVQRQKKIKSNQMCLKNEI